MALTFDDGPSPYTPQVANVLEQKNVPGTFFFIGKMVGDHPGIVARLRHQGFEVESHTWSHPDLTALSTTDVMGQIERTNTVLGSAKFLRPPYGKYNQAVVNAAHRAGMRLAFWSVDTLDWLHEDVQSILDHVKTETKPGAVILMHDGGGDRSQTVAALPLVIEWLRSQDYSFVRLDELAREARPRTIK